MPTRMSKDRIDKLIGDRLDRLNRCFCPECGKLRMKSPSGAVCLDHKLVTGITQRDLRDAELAKFAKQLKSLPVAKKNKKRWQIGDQFFEVAPKDCSEPVTLAVAESPEYLRLLRLTPIEPK